MTNFDVAGLKISGTKKSEFLDNISERLKNTKKTWVTTVYSEFLFWALKDPKIMNMLNEADFSLPDGVGIFWAKQFLEIPITAKSHLGKILQSIWQAITSLINFLFKKRAFETLAGSEIIWDLVKIASENNLSIFLLGGFGNTAQLTANKLISQSNNKLKIAGYSNKNPNDKSAISEINSSKADILFVSYGPIKQEQWILKNRDQLTTVKLAIGLGGTFDYIAGKKLTPPKFVRTLGFEWLFRLFTQPYRLKRIYNATFGLIKLLVKYKFFKTFPLRPNVAVVIKNSANEILVCQRQPGISKFYSEKSTLKNRFDNYWQFPQGGIDGNEDIVKAAEREALEETGLKNLKFIRLSKKTHAYEWNNAIRKINLNRKLLYRGQLQHVAYFEYSGNFEDVKVDQKEFINFKWLPQAALLNTIHEERAGLTKIVVEDLSLL